MVLAILYSTQKKGRYLTKTSLHKILTILMKESRLGKLTPFTLKPYHYGPYSPDAEKIVEELKRRGLVVEEVFNKDGKEIHALKLTEEGFKAAKESYERLFSVWGGGKAAAIIDAWTGASPSALIYYVYLKYPELTTRSRIRDKVLGEVGAK